jgi:hypothetical protein
MSEDSSKAGGVLPMHVAQRLCDALASCNRLDETLEHIEAARQEILGPGLLTLNVNATQDADPPGEFQLRRAWSSRPLDYPPGGRKRKLPTPWTKQLLERGEIFIGEGELSLKSAFDDATKIIALGLRSVVNVPFRSGGRSVAILNVLGPRSQWSPSEIVVVRLFALLVQPVVLRALDDLVTVEARPVAGQDSI